MNGYYEDKEHEALLELQKRMDEHSVRIHEIRIHEESQYMNDDGETVTQKPSFSAAIIVRPQSFLESGTTFLMKTIKELREDFDIYSLKYTDKNGFYRVEFSCQLNDE